jgi:hypothetical protein
MSEFALAAKNICWKMLNKERTGRKKTTRHPSAVQLVVMFHCAGKLIWQCLAEQNGTSRFTGFLRNYVDFRIFQC